MTVQTLSKESKMGMKTEQIEDIQKRQSAEKKQKAIKNKEDQLPLAYETEIKGRRDI